MPNLYRNESSDARTNAQRNLIGRTHYVDDDTLRWHKSRVLSSRVVDGGLLFAIITSDALDMNNRKRGFRYVVFNIFGEVISRVNLENTFSAPERASKAMWVWLNECDAKAVTLAAIEAQERSFAREMAELRAVVEAKQAA